MNHHEEAVEVEEVLVVDLDVVVVSIVTSPMMRTHSLPLEPLIIWVLLKVILRRLQKGVVMVHHEVLIVVVVVVDVEASAMVKLMKKDDLEEHLNATVELAEGDVITNNDLFLVLIFFSILMSLALFAEVDSNVKALDVVTGEHKVMKLLSKHTSYNIVLL